MKLKKCIIIILVYLALSSSLVSANRGMMVLSPRDVSLQESGQNAIVAWNGNEEVIILSTDTKSSESASVLQVIPLPSNPTKVEEGSFESFKKLTEIINKKAKAIREQAGTKGGFGAARSAPGIEITFHNRIGAHDVTIVKVNDLDYFINWVEKFTANKGFEQLKISSEFNNTVSNYLNRDIRFFVFDNIETGKDIQSIKPLIYRFNSGFLYYPLEITATSDAGWSSSQVNVFLIAKGVVDETKIRSIHLTPGTGFDDNIELSRQELKDVSPELEDLFGSDPLVMNAYYSGPLNILNEDLVIYQQDIHIPTFIEKISQSISSSLVFQWLYSMYSISRQIDDAPIWAQVFLAIILLSFIAGIPSFVFIIARLIKNLLKRYSPASSGYDLIFYIISISIAMLLLMSNDGRLVVPVLVIFIITGFSMIVFLMTKFFKNYVF